MAIRSTLSEVNTKLGGVLYLIMNALDPTRWQNSGQVIYSTVDEWITAQEAFKVFNRKREVKFPFASLTRTPVDKENMRPWADNFVAYECPEGVSDSVKTARIKPVRIKYSFTIYENLLEDIEAFSDLIIVDGRQTQRLDYFSEILQQPSRISFLMEEPTHNMVPNREEKRDQKGFIYSMTVPILVDAVLGLPGQRNLITEILLNAHINNIEQETTIIT